MTRPTAVRGTGAGRVGEPHKLPAEPAHDGMAAVAADQLSFGGLRERFAQTRVWHPEVRDDRIVTANESTRDAAVLIPLVTVQGETRVILTTRPATLNSHSGQIAFPGGGVDPNDTDRRETALREASEEIALNPTHVDVIGELPEYVTNSGFAVTTVIGLIEGQPELKANPVEVEEIFQVPLSFLMDPDNHERRRFNYQGHERTFFSMPWVAGTPPVEYFIWGVTATILRNFYHFLRATDQE